MSNSTSIRQDSFRSASVVNYSRDTVPELASEESLDYQDGNVALQSNYQFELSTQSSQIPMTEEQMKKILKGALDQMEERISQRIERLERRVGEIQKMVYKIPKPLEKREESPKKTILSHMSKVREMDQEQEEEEQQSNSQRQDEMIEQLPQSELDQSSGSPRMVRSVGYQGQQVREGESFMLRSVPVGRQFTYEELAQQAKELNKKCLKSIENFKKIIGKRS